MKVPICIQGIIGHFSHKIVVFLIVIMLLILFSAKAEVYATNEDSSALRDISRFWKIAAPSICFGIAGGYLALTMPGIFAFPNDIPIIENPQTPPIWRFRNDFSTLVYLSKDETTLANKTNYNIQFQQIFVSVQSQFGLPWDFAIEAKTSGFNSSLGLKKIILKSSITDLACRGLATVNPSGIGYSFSISISKPFISNHVLFSPIFSPGIKRGTSWITPSVAIKDTFPKPFRDNFSSTPFVKSDDIIVDFPFGIEFGFHQFAFSIYGSYSYFIKNYSQEIVNDGAFETICAYAPKHHVVIGFITSLYKY